MRQEVGYLCHWRHGLSHNRQRSPDEDIPVSETRNSASVALNGPILVSLAVQVCKA